MYIIYYIYSNQYIKIPALIRKVKGKNMNKAYFNLLYPCWIYFIKK